jgi:hypothetical protein
MEEGFHVAVGVNHHVAGLAPELQGSRFPLEEALEEILEEKAARGDAFGPRDAEFAIILNKHGITGRLQKDHGAFRVVFGQKLYVVACVGSDGVEMSLAEGGPAATLASGGQRDLIAGGFQDGHGGDADVRFMIANEGVVPEEDATAVAGGAGRPTGEPAVEPVAGEARQRPVGGDTGHASEPPTPWRPTEQPVSEGRQDAAEPAEAVDRADQPFPQANPLTFHPRVEQLGLKQTEVHVGRTLHETGLAAQTRIQDGREFRGREWFRSPSGGV